MANHEIKYPREFVQEVRKFEDEDKAVSGLWNEPTCALLNNDVYLKEQIENNKKAADNHIDDESIHVTEELKKTWTNKAENTVATELSDGLMEKEDKKKIGTVKENAEENQNAFSNIKIGTITITANGKTAQFELAAGTNIKIVGDNATKKIIISSPDKQPASFIQQDAKNRFMTDEEKGKLEEIEAGANKYAHPDNINTRHVTDAEKKIIGTVGNVTSLNTTDKSSLVAAVNECFQNASDGKKAIADAAGADSNATFQAIANELNEQKKVLFNAHKMDTQSTSIRAQAKTIDVYVHNHLPSMIVNNGGKLVANGGAAVTQNNSTLDTLYYSIQNLAAVKNNLINAATNEKNQWVANYNDMVNQKNTWHQNYLNMEADRNNWMNLANSKKSYSAGTIPNTYGSTAIKVRTGFRPKIVHLGCTKSGGTPCNIAYVADYNIQYKAGYGGDGASGGDGTIVMESDGFTFRIPISSSIQLYSIYYLAWS